MADMFPNEVPGSRHLWRRALVGVFLVSLGLGLAPRAFADEVVGLFHLRAPQVLTTPRDPAAFMEDLNLVLPRPVVIMNRQDAVARELLAHSRSLSEVDALRTAQALCEEGETLNWDPLLLLALIHIESYYDHLAVSPVGAEGLMQLMPYTAEWMAERIGMPWPDRHSFDPVLNVRLGVRYLAHLRSEYFSRLDYILTAYNRGPSATRYIVSRHGGLPKDIRDFYATKVLVKYEELKAKYGHLPLG